MKITICLLFYCKMYSKFTEVLFSQKHEPLILLTLVSKITGFIIFTKSIAI